PEGRWFSVQFALVRDRDNPKSRDDWKDLLTQPVLNLPMDVTLGILGDDGKTIYGSPTYVLKGARDSSNIFAFRRIPFDGWTVIGFLLFITAFAIFIYLALRTTILRDPSEPARPDGLPPVSLGRCQMAFWFF